MGREPEIDDSGIDAGTVQSVLLGEYRSRHGGPTGSEGRGSAVEPELGRAAWPANGQRRRGEPEVVEDGFDDAWPSR